MARHLMVCSGGGHLKQLFTLSSRIGIRPEDQLWVTYENDLSKSLLADRDVVFMPYTGSRDGRNIARNALRARRIIRKGSFDTAVSTGSSPAVSFLHIAARRGVDCHYIETAARATGPSLTGTIISKDRRIQTYSQYPAWAGERWLYRGSIFDEYAVGPVRDTVSDQRIRKAVVSIGHSDEYSFDRMFRYLAPLLEGVEVLWQTGMTDTSKYNIQGRHSVPHHELSAAVAEADVVIAHSGTGAALTAFERGHCPVLVPRLAVHNEHVDDHQVQIARELHGRGLAVMCHAEELSEEILLGAAKRSTIRLDNPPPFQLAS